MISVCLVQGQATIGPQAGEVFSGFELNSAGHRHSWTVVAYPWSSLYMKMINEGFSSSNEETLCM